MKIGTELRLMTYNIRLGLQAGLEAIARVLCEADPDIVALQEVGSRWTMGPEGETTSALAEACGFSHALFVPTIVRGPARYGHALLSRWPLEASVEPLPRRVDEPRALLTARIETPGGPASVCATHLSHIDDRAAQGRLLYERARARARAGVASFVLGDLNEVPHEAKWFEALLAQHFQAAPGGPTFPAEAPERRIDHALADRSYGRWLGAELVGTSLESDHLGVVADWICVRG